MSLMSGSQEKGVHHNVLSPTAGMERVSLGYLFWIFLKIGCVAFGGFMALISVIADTVVEKRKLLTPDDMLDGISLANLLPGPQGVNCVVYIGYRLRGAWEPSSVRSAFSYRQLC